jgi:hypothetical protein
MIKNERRCKITRAKADEACGDQRTRHRCPKGCHPRCVNGVPPDMLPMLATPGIPQLIDEWAVELTKQAAELGLYE